jgi:transcriptional antiterminator RfaH
MVRWYLIHSKPCAETVAQANLERQGFVVYYPRLQQPVLRRERWKEAIVPLFPRYLFLRLDDGLQCLSPVRSTVGVAGIVRFGNRFATVPDQFIVDLRARADHVSGLHSLNRHTRLRAGMAVRVAAGPLSGLEGVFERHAGADRVVILLSILGRDSVVGIPADFVVPRLAM